MSYYELQSFASLMTQLGFPRPISVDTFRSPNFTLVAEILYYIVTVIAPNDGLSLDIATQDDRVYFISAAVNVLQAKLHVKLNAKKIYAAGSEAVRELRKVAQEVATYIGATSTSTDRDTSSGNCIDLTLHSNTLRTTLSKIIESSAKLLTHLRLHIDEISEAMQQAMSSQPDAVSLSTAVQQRIKNLAAEHNALQEELTTNKRERVKLEEQIAEKKQSIMHTMDRLDAIRLTKPPFLGELEALEADLSKLHIEYARKFRSLLFLEGQLRVNDVREQQRVLEREKNLQILQENALKEELNNMYGGMDMHTSSSNQDEELIDTPMPQVMDLHPAHSTQNSVPPPRPAPINTNAEIPDDESYSYSYEEEEEATFNPPNRRVQAQHRGEVCSSDKQNSPENIEDGEYSYEYSDMGGEELDPDNIDF